VPIRLTFVCHAVTKSMIKEFVDGRHVRRVVYAAKFHAVTREHSADNAAFFTATPFGHFEVGTYAADQFQVGEHYYFDVSLAAPAALTSSPQPSLARVRPAV
jgi:hypothetical protein